MSNSIARRNLRNSINREHPDIIFIQETKCDEITPIMKASLWDGSHSWAILSAQGQSGGIATSWDGKTISLTNSAYNKNWIWMRWSITRDNNNITFFNGINVYGPHTSTSPSGGIIDDYHEFQGGTILHRR